jgi:hypothetical protein
VALVGSVALVDHYSMLFPVLERNSRSSARRSFLRLDSEEFCSGGDAVNVDVNRRLIGTPVQ